MTIFHLIFILFLHSYNSYDSEIRRKRARHLFGKQLASFYAWNPFHIVFWFNTSGIILFKGMSMPTENKESVTIIILSSINNR